MDDAWKASQKKRVEAWNEELKRKKEDEERLRLEAEKLEAEEKQQREEEEKKLKAEEEKKRVKLPGLSKDTVISAKPRSPIPQYALKKIIDKNWVEHDFFTPRMAAKATIQSHTTAANPFSELPESNPLHALATIVDDQKPRGAIPDESLSFRDLMLAGQQFMRTIEENGWEEEHVEAWNLLYFELDRHPYRLEKDDIDLYEEALVRYHAQAKREFFDAVKRKDKKVFNIGIIGEQRLENILNSLKRERETALQKRSIAAIEQMEKVSTYVLLCP